MIQRLMYSLLLVLTSISCFATPIFAQQEALTVSGSEDRIKVKVTQVMRTYAEPNEYGPAVTIQEIQAMIVTGGAKGQLVTFKNDYAKMEVGDKVFLDTTILDTGEKIYAVSDFDRRWVLVMSVLIFVALVIGFGKMQGLRSLVSLGVSILAIFFVLIPLLIRGYSPVLIATLVSTAILFFAIFFTHGFNKKSLIAFSGTVLAVIVTSLLAQAAVIFGNITGLFAEESAYLNYHTQGVLNFSGLFLASIIIGMLGVLDDISITQVAVVRELYASSKTITKKEVFNAAIRVGKEHVGALVNTLVLAYIGVALPTVMYFSLSTMGVGELINRELFANEILRTVLGSVGLILTVPITTWLAVVFLNKFRGQPVPADESHHGHSHGGHKH